MPSTSAAEEPRTLITGGHDDASPTRLVSDPLLPDQVGAFVFEYVVGTGGSSTVYRAHDERSGTPVAVKVLRRNPDLDPRALDRMTREATAAGRVSHPGVVPVLGSGRLPDGRPWLAMPFLDGDPLDRLLEARGRLPWPLVIPVLGELASTLRAVHAAGVVHRDLKPSNVFVARLSDGTVGLRLLDFGLALLGDARAGVPQTSVQSTAGTPEFSAPEQALGQAVSGASDLYALGVTAWQLLAGRLPFGDETGTDVRHRHVFDDAPPLPSSLKVPSRLRALVAALLAKAPTDRPQARAVIEALNGLWVDAPASAEGLLERLAQQWAATHSPSLVARVRHWLAW